MAKRIITESYVFNPSTRTVIIVGKYIRQEQLLLVTNVTQNTVIYNFSDPTLGYTSFSQLTTGSNESTTVILSYNTSAQSATDKLAILVEEADETLRPSETLMDPVGKMRMSTAQSLIDTDFEYGSQPTKWESGSLLANRASTYFDATTGLQIGGMQALARPSGGSYQVQVTSSTFPTTGTQVWPQTNGSLFVQGSLDAEKVDGWWLASSAAGYSAGTGLVVTAIAASFTVSGNPSIAVAGTGYAVGDIIRLDQTVILAAVVYVSQIAAGGIGAVSQVTVITGGGTFAAGATTSTVIGTGYNTANSTFAITHAAIALGTNILSSVTLPLGYVPAGHTSGALLVGTAVAHPLLPAGTVVSAVLASGYALSNAATGNITSNNGLYFGPVAFYSLLVGGATVLYAGAGTSLSDYSKGYIYSGNFYSGAAIPVQYDTQTAAATTSISWLSNVITVKTAYPHGLALNDHVMIANLSATTNAPNGTFAVSAVPTTNSFTYTAYAAPTGTITIGDCFITACSSATAGATSITTSTATGTPQVGQLLIAASTAVEANTFITSVSGTTIGLSKPLLAAATSVNMHASSMLNCVYPRTMGYVAHRAFDGGVQFTNQRPFHGYTVYRQTRRYFRYQSGKGIQFSTGSILRPSIPIESITSSATTATVTTRIPHGLETGSTVTISGATQPEYNISAVATVSSQTVFTYTIVTVSNVTARNFDDSSGIQVSPALWYGAKNRIGMFDSQNGFFFEYDGQQLYAVRRSSTTQIQGYATFTPGSSSVIGSAATLFGARLKTGDMIVVRGMSYLVSSITSDTQMTISPEYRGSANITQCTISKTIDIRIPQSQWNIDKANGTGPSGYNIDLSKMQMWYMDYSWYGAGSIRFGIKNARGEVIYLHRIVNSNQNTEAYMRSGNLPARYETSTVSFTSYLTSGLASSGAATVTVANAAGWPTSGTVLISDKLAAASASTGAQTGSAGTQVFSTSSVSGTFLPGMLLAGGGTGVIDSNTVVTAVSGDGAANSVIYLSKPLLAAPSSQITGSGPSNTTVIEYATYTSLSAGATFVGSISGNILTVSSVSNGTILPNSYISTTSSTIPGVLPGTQIGTYTSGGGSSGTGTYPVNIAQNVPSCTMTGGPWSMGISSRAQSGGNTILATISVPTVLVGPFPSISLHSPLQASTIAHWGSSVIMDGRYDDDKSLIFGAGLANAITFSGAGTRRALISLRISPSVDSGLTGLIGQREVLNRMQMVLRQVDCLTTVSSFRIDLILNGVPFGASLPSWQAVGGSSLAQVAYHTSGIDVINFGEIIYTFFTTSSGVTQQDLNLVRDLGTNVLGGGRSSSMSSGSRLNIYPDGPDVVTLVATPISASGTIISRISWTEAQA